MTINASGSRVRITGNKITRSLPGKKRGEKMSGTKDGGIKASATNKEKYGADYYQWIGRKGGRASHAGGFASEKVGKDGLTGPERAKKFGRIGGLISRKGTARKEYEPKDLLERAAAGTSGMTVYEIMAEKAEDWDD